MGKIADLEIEQTDLAECRLKAFEDSNEFTPYQYLDASGKLQFTIARVDRKDGTKICLPFDSESNKGYPQGGKPRSRPLFNLPEISKKPSGAKVVIVEGEKCVAAGEKVFPDGVVSTWTGGGQAIDKTDWKPLEIREVLCITDTDEAGRNAMRKIADKLRKLYCTVRIYQRDGDDHSDIFDWSEGLEYKELRELQEEIELNAVDPKTKVNSAASLIARELTFDDHEPWPDKVDGDELLSSVAKTIDRHMHIDKKQSDAVALWILLAWIHPHENIDVAAFLNLSSPAKRSGKTTLLGIVEEFCPRALSATDVSVSALFRIIEQSAPTFMFDELDLKASKGDDSNKELSALLNGSQCRAQARVIRSEAVTIDGAKTFLPVQFGTWCAKVLCGIGGLRDTTLDRCITIHLERKPATLKLPRWRNRDKELVKELVQKLARWSDDNADKIVAGRDEGKLPESLNDRQQDSWEILFAVASAAGGNWPQRVRDACLHVVKSTSDNESIAELLITHVRDAFRVKSDHAFVETRDILSALNSRDDGPWSTWRNGNPMNAHNLGRQLSPFGIRPTQKKVGPEKQRGYLLSEIKPVADKYAIAIEGGSKRYSGTDGEKPM